MSVRTNQVPIYPSINDDDTLLGVGRGPEPEGSPDGQDLRWEVATLRAHLMPNAWDIPAAPGAVLTGVTVQQQLDQLDNIVNGLVGQVARIEARLGPPPVPVEGET